MYTPHAELFTDRVKLPWTTLWITSTSATNNRHNVRHSISIIPIYGSVTSWISRRSVAS